MKRIISLLLIMVLALSLTACKKQEEISENTTEPELAQMKAICELATMDCYFHNVAKFFEEDAQKGFLGIGAKDKHFWIEYSGVVTVGVDASLVSLEIVDNEVRVTIPEAKVLDVRIDSKKINKDSFIVAKKSVEPTAEDETVAIAEAQTTMEETAINNPSILANAQEAAKSLIKEYIDNIGESMGVKYNITWVYVDDAGEATGEVSVSEIEATEESTEEVTE